MEAEPIKPLSHMNIRDTDSYQKASTDTKQNINYIATIQFMFTGGNI